MKLLMVEVQQDTCGVQMVVLVVVVLVIVLIDGGVILKEVHQIHKQDEQQ